MRPDHTSMLLEIVSFFLVTIDLYGKDRLLSAHNKLISFLRDYQNLNPMRIWKNILRGNANAQTFRPVNRIVQGNVDRGQELSHFGGRK